MFPSVSHGMLLSHVNAATPTSRADVPGSSGVHCACGKMKLSLEVSGNVRRSKDGFSLFFLHLFLLLRPIARSVPRSLQGTSPICRCPGDLYTSPAHPHPPVWSARPLNGRKERLLSGQAQTENNAKSEGKHKHYYN